MKTNEEFTNDVIGKINKKEKSASKRRVLLMAVSAALCVCLLAGTMAVLFQKQSPTPPVVPETSDTDHPAQTGESNVQSDDTNPSDTQSRTDSQTTPYEDPFEIVNPDFVCGINITPTKFLSNGTVATDTEFTVTTKDETTVQALTELLTLSPDVGCTLSETESGYVLTPTETLTEHCLYKILIGDAENPDGSFVFQTDESFKITELYPGNGKTAVGLNTAFVAVFSESVSLDSFREHYSIIPECAGSFSLSSSGKTVTFIPDADLKENTAYTFTVAPGVVSSDGDTLEKGGVSSFGTLGDGAKNHIYSFSQYQYSYLSGTEALLYFGRVNGAGKDDAFTSYAYDGCDCKLYSYPSVSAAYSELLRITSDPLRLTNADCALSREGLTEVNAKLTITPTEKTIPNSMNGQYDKNYAASSYPYSSDSYGYYTGSLGVLKDGAYLLELTFKDTINGESVLTSVQLLLLVSPYRAVTEQYNGGIMAFITDKDNKPVYNAEITMTQYENEQLSDEGQSAKTDKTGVARFTREKETSGYAYDETDDSAYFYLKGDKGDFFFLRGTGLTNAATSSYVGFIYTDRTTYFTSDTVNFYGALYGVYGMTLPDGVYFTVDNGKEKHELSLTSDGTFTGSFSFEDDNRDIKYIRLYTSDGEYITYAIVSVTSDSLPVYRGTVGLDRLWYRQGDTATVSGSVTFFDGTPAVGIRLTVRVDNLDGVTVVTDAYGKYSAKFTLSGYLGAGYPASQITANAELSGYEDTSLSLTSEYSLYFTKDKYCSYEYVSGGVKLLMYDLVPENIKTRQDMTASVYIGGLSKVSFTAKGDVEAYVKQTVTESYYDPISRGKRQKSTASSAVDKTAALGSFTASDGSVMMPYYTLTGGQYYAAYLLITVSCGSETYYLDNLSALPLGEQTAYDEYDYYTLRLNGETSYQRYSPGQKVTATVYYGNKPASGGVYLFTVIGDGLLYTYVSGEPSYTFTFTRECMNTVQLQAVRVDKNAMNAPYPLCANVMSESYTVSVTSDKTSYKPGDTVKVTVKVTDSEGLPVNDANILLSVVDEACFALDDYSNDYVYKNLHGITLDYMTIILNDYNTSGGGVFVDWKYDAVKKFSNKTCGLFSRGDYDIGGKGSGGDESSIYLREDFEYNPVFEVKTGKNGTAEYTFKVPDNITTWRLTALAYKYDVTGNIGVNYSDAVCTLPFFINPGVTEKLTSRDDVTINAGFAGMGVSEGDSVKATCKLFDKSGKLLTTKTADAKVGGCAWFYFGKLSAGEYYVELYADCGKYSDGIKQELEVRASLSSADVEQQVTAVQASKLDAASYPVTLTFTDKEMADFLQSLQDMMYSGYTSSRNDAKTAAAVADALYRYYTQKSTSLGIYSISPSDTDGELSFGKLDFGNGLIGTWSDGTGLYSGTALICAAAPEVLTDEYKAKLINTLYSALDEKMISLIDYARIYLSLTALGEPVYTDLKALLSTCKPTTSVKTLIYLATAFDRAGDRGTALALCDFITENYIKTNESGAAYITAKDAQTSWDLTADALLLYTNVYPQTAAKLYKYVQSGITEENICYLQLAYYYRYVHPRNDADRYVEYTINGKTVRVDIGNWELFRLELNKSEYAGFSITDISENVVIRADYRCFASALKDVYTETDGKMTITKTVEATETENLFKVTIKVSNWCSGARVYDTLPAGFVRMGAFRGYGVNITQKGGSLCFGRNKLNSSGDVSIVYFIRSAARGEYVYEPALLYYEGTWIKTEQLTINVK